MLFGEFLSASPFLELAEDSFCAGLELKFKVFLIEYKPSHFKIYFDCKISGFNREEIKI
jgi:hypothetical protein